MKPFMRKGILGFWLATSGRRNNWGALGLSKCPFVAYMRWMERSIKAGEQ